MSDMHPTLDDKTLCAIFAFRAECSVLNHFRITVLVHVFAAQDPVDVRAGDLDAVAGRLANGVDDLGGRDRRGHGLLLLFWCAAGARGWQRF